MKCSGSGGKQNRKAALEMSSKPELTLESNIADTVRVCQYPILGLFQYCVHLLKQIVNWALLKYQEEVLEHLATIQET